MKKIISFILVCLAFVPTLLFAGCSNNDTDASAVKNTIYYVTSAQKDSVDTTETYVNANMKIIFYDDLFKVEYSDQNNQAEYGYYLGTFTTNEDLVTLNTTEYGGTFIDYENNTARQECVFSILKYNKGKLTTAFTNKGSIVKYTLEQR